MGEKADGYREPKRNILFGSFVDLSGWIFEDGKPRIQKEF
jgi:hypothetical protein